MCGLVGVAGQQPVRKRGWLDSACATLAHRGPDGTGEWWSADGRVGIAHRRLAVIDLSAAASQPMLDARGETCIAFNGEVYNFREIRALLTDRGHVFRSGSDTEVVLAAYHEWGTECLARLHGMFAFAIYDTRSARLLIARDRAGEKPVFYSFADGAVRFASELKALMADPSLPRRVDLEALDCYLTLGFVPGDRCLLRGVRKLPPAHAVEFDLDSGHMRVWRYWALPAYDAALATAPVAAVDELEILLENAVRRQLVADVPVGILLSGGIDSSLVTAMAARVRPAIRTFTVRFPGYDRFDETDHARLIARHFGTEHTELVPGETTVDMLPALARQFDEPIVDSSMVPTFLVTRELRKHCTVALGGDGGDELFGGYSGYSRLLRLQRLTGGIPRPARAIAAAAAGALLPVGFRGRNWLAAMRADYAAEQPAIAVLFDRATRRRLLNGRTVWPYVGEDVLRQRTPATPDMLQRATRLDFENFLAEDILVKVDRASMMNSLEVRAPFLDVPLIEFAYRTVPSSLKATDRARKILLRRLCSRVLPAAFDQNRKQGFSIPLDAWLQTPPWRSFFEEALFDDGQTLFEKRPVRSLFDGLARGRSNGERLFALVMFELWRREYRVEL